MVKQYFLQDMKTRSAIDVLKESLTENRSLEASDVHSSIQSDVRYQLIIDPSDDQSVMRLLFTFGLLDRENTKMIVWCTF